MATSRNLGSLVIDLVARVGGFTKGMSEAERASDKATRAIEKQNKERARAVKEAWGTVSNVIVGAFTAVGVVAALRKIGQETIQSQNEQAQLAAVLRSTGEAAGFSAVQLNEMANSLAKQSTFGAGDIVAAQTRLLSYSNIVGEEFPRALQAAIDMAARFGTDVASAAETVGKALDSPKDGLAALSKQGFRFTEDQKALVEELQNTGRAAEAQAIVLSEIEKAYAGAAVAARDTFGGALKALGETVNDLATGDDSSFAEATRAVNGFTEVLGSPTTAAAFAKIIELVAKLGSALVRGATDLTAFLTGSAQATANLYTEQLEQSTKRIEQLDNAYKLDPSDRRKKALDAERARWDALSKSRQGATDALLGQFGGRVNPGDAADFAKLDYVAGQKTGPDATGAAARIKAQEEAAKKARDAAKKALNDAEAARKASAEAVKSLIEQVALLGAVGEEERLLTQIRLGSSKFVNDADKQKALASARLIDDYKRESDAFEAQKKAFKDAREEAKKLEEDRVKRIAELTGDDAVKKQIDDMNLLLKAFSDGEISFERFKGAFDGLNEKIAETKDETGEFVKEAARGIQNTLGDALYNIGENGFKGLGKTFADTLRKMAADALAAKLAEKLFGDFDKKGGGLGGIVGELFGGGGGDGFFSKISGFFGGLLGPGRATGGAIFPNTLHPVNEQGPELLTYGSKQYLMGGAQGGFVTPITPSSGGGSKQPIINNYGAQVDTYMSNDQLIIEIDKRIGKQGPKMVERQLSNPNSRGGKALSRNTTASWRRS